MIAPHFRTLLLMGERGCGQENVVHLLQILSPCHAGPLLALNAAEAAKRLQSPKRLLQSVAGGVLFLDGVDQLTPEAQSDLLRLMRLNRHHLCALVAFSEYDLRALVVADGYSAALADDLGSFCLTVPSLRDRRADLPLLAEVFLREAQAASGRESTPLSLGSDLLDDLSLLDWPGNLDQLRCVVKLLVEAPPLHAQAAEPSRSTLLDASDLQVALARFDRDASLTGTVAANAHLVKLDQVVQEHIRAVLIACQGNKLRASEILGISRSTLYRMLGATPSGTLAMLA